MRSFSLTVLFFLLLGMCGLCAVQWWRESKLRELALSTRGEITTLTRERNDLNDRLKAADAEMLRVTTAFTELRTNSVPKAELDAAVTANDMLKARIQEQSQAIARQNEALKQQNELLQKQAESVKKANGTIQQVTSERDDLVKKANDATARYNALLKKNGGDGG